MLILVIYEFFDDYFSNKRGFMKVIVTGAHGFLGKTLCPLLRQRGDEVVEMSSKMCDLRDRSALNQFSKGQFDRIYHLATWTQAGDFCLRHPAEQWLHNQKIHTNLLDWWQSDQPQAKMIAIGTSCAYDPAYPLEEKYYHSGAPIESLFAYGMTKRMLLTGLQSLQKQYGLEYFYPVSPVLHGIDGFSAKKGKQMHFIFDLMKKIVRGKYFDEPVILWGDGSQKRELMAISDFAKALLKLSDQETNEVVNIGEGKEYSIRELAQVIAERVGFPFEKVQFDTSRYVGARSKVMSIDKMKEKLPGFTPEPALHGIRPVVDWLCEDPSRA